MAIDTSDASGYRIAMVSPDQIREVMAELGRRGGSRHTPEQIRARRENGLRRRGQTKKKLSPEAPTAPPSSLPKEG
jgi:hypothetical protein